MRSRMFVRRMGIAAVFATIVATANPVWAGAWGTAKAVLLPGVGQAERGHYSRAAVLGGAAIISWVGLLATQVNYARTVDRYEDAKRTYLFYPVQAGERGQVVSASEIAGTYREMTDAWNGAEDDVKWRNGFIVAVAAVYAVNIVDLLLSEPDTGEVKAPPVSVEIDRQGFRLVKVINF